MKLTIFLLLSLLTIPSCKQNQTLRVGVECGYPPYLLSSTKLDEFAIKTTNNQVCRGYDARLMNHISADLNVEFSYYMYEFDGLLLGLLNNQLDLIIGGISPSENRKKQIDFTIPYFQSKLVLVAKKENEIDDISLLANKRLIAQSGSIQDELIKQIPNVTHLTPLPDLTMLVQAINSNIADYLILEEVSAKVLLINYPNLLSFTLDELSLSDESQMTSIGLKKNNKELKNKLDNSIQKINEETKNDWLEVIIDSLRKNHD